MTAATMPARAAPDAVFAVVRDAVAVVCERSAEQIRAETDLDALGADSLARVEIAEIVEAQLSSYLPGLHIADDDLDGFATVGDAVDYLLARL